MSPAAGRRSVPRARTVLGRLLERLEETIIALLLVGMTLLVFVEVVLRFGFAVGFLWSQELTLHLAAWLVLFGASYGVRTRAHIGVDVVVKLLPPGPRRLAGIAAVLLSLLYCGLLGYGAWVYLSKMRGIGIPMEDLPVPLWLGHGILFAGLVLLALRFGQLLWRLIGGREQALELADEAATALDEVRSKERDAARSKESDAP